MATKTHLQFIYDRLVNVHGEKSNVDYMLRLEEIVKHSSDISDIRIGNVPLEDLA